MIKITRDNMAYVYAGAMSCEVYPIKELNAKIMRRWSFSGLVYIKEKAHKVLSQLHKKLESNYES